MRRLAPLLALIRAEGLASVSRRAIDRLSSTGLDAPMRPTRLDRLPPTLALPERGGAPFLLLNVLSTPLHRRSGLPLLAATRLAAEASSRPLAVLEPRTGGWILHLRRAGVTARVWYPELEGASAEADRSWRAAIARAADDVGAEAVHVDGVSGVNLEQLGQVAADRRPLLLTLYDFGLYCPRPHLIESGTDAFCEYSQDDARCGQCLARASLPAIGPHRRAAAIVLARAAAVISLSSFLRNRHLALFRESDQRRHHVVAPCGPIPPRPLAATAAPDVTRVAFVGSFKTHKGAAVFLDVVRMAAGSSSRPRQWIVIGGSDGEPWLSRARALAGVRALGFYPPGELPRLLRREAVGVALLLSTCPESFSQTLSECFAAGVAVIAFDHGAIAERVRAARRGCDRLVPLTAGTDGVLTALDEVADRPLSHWQPSPPLPTPSSCATHYLNLYRAIGLRVGENRSSG